MAQITISSSVTEFLGNTYQTLSFVHVGAGIQVNKIVTLKRKASRGFRTLEQIHYITLLYAE
jgi:hypothetical protein